MCSANAFFTLRARVSPRRTHLCWPRAQRAAKIFGCAEHVRSLGRAHAPNSLVTQSRDRTSTEDVHRQTHRPAPLVRRSRSGCAASEIPPRERSERRKFWPYGRKSRPPNARFSVRAGVSRRRTGPPAPAFRSNARNTFSWSTCKHRSVTRSLRKATTARRGHRGENFLRCSRSPPSSARPSSGR